MEVLRPIDPRGISEIRILENVRLIYRRDLNPVCTKDNIRVQFELSGQIKGHITCHLCLDGLDLTPAEKNYLFPLFVESMNILVGKQLTHDDSLKQFDVKLSSPKINMIPLDINTANRSMTQKYELELEDLSYSVLTEYNLQAMN